MALERALPERVHLPSGQVVRLSDAAARAASARTDPGASATERDFALLGAEGVLSGDDRSPLDPGPLTLRDANVLRALLAWAGVVDEEVAEYSCENCDQPFEVAPSTILEIGPFVEGELDDPELDAPFAFGILHPIPPVRIARRTARTVRLVPRTVGEGRALWRRGPNQALVVTPSLVAAMGIAEIGPVRKATAIAAALSTASEDAWGAVVDLYNDAHYGARLAAVVRCEECGARNDVEAPLERDLPREPLRPARRDDDSFPDLDAFEAAVRAVADRVYRARGVRNVALFVDAGVAACDDGGEPLLGCYTHGGADPVTGIERPPEVRIFYRTFESEFRHDPSFDVDAEIRETVEHEIQHHIQHLSGDDPMDDAERSEIERDEVRRVGPRTAIRRGAGAFVTDLAGFVRATWPIWVVVAAVFALTWCA